MLGGNQSDAVTRTWIAKSRCIAARWPHGFARTRPIRIAHDARPASRAEA